jgi:UDP-glucose:(heptosyl)LPS alpha-1,3-glucosyltransferase
MKKIALIRQKYAPDGGAEKAIESISTLLKKTGSYDITLITREWHKKNCAYSRVIVCNPFYIGRAWRDISFEKAACKVVSQENFDIVQSHERITCCDIYRLGDGLHKFWINTSTSHPLAKLLKRLSFYHRHILKNENSILHNERTKILVANSDYVIRQIQDIYPSSNKKTLLIENAVDQKKFHEIIGNSVREKTRVSLNLSENDKVLIFIGSGFKRKGVDMLLQLIHILPEEYKLIIIGKDKNEAAYKNQSKSLNITDRIRFVGKTRDVNVFLWASDLFVLPSKYDPYPNAAIEAAACGIPVLASNRTGAAELSIKLGFPELAPEEISEWAKTILKFFSEPHKKINFDLSNFSEQAITKKWQRLYQDL